MKFLITENKLQAAVSKFLTNEFSKLKKFKSRIFPTGEFYIDSEGGIMAEVVKVSYVNAIVVDYRLWVLLSDFFSVETTKELQTLISNWANDYFDMKDTLVDFREFQETIDDL